jgi:TolA-binding protein
MSHPVDVHPEDLFDREQDGTLTPDERRRLDSHTLQCAACALVRSAVRDFAAQRSSAPGDDALIARISGEALGRAAAISSGTISPALHTTYTGLHPRRRRSWAVGAMVLFAATGATASFWSVRGAIVQRLLNVPAPVETAAPAPEVKLPVVARKVAPPAPVVETPEALPEPEAPPVVVTPVAPAPVFVARPRAPEPVNVPPPVVGPSSNELFAAANEARRSGDAQKSFELYTELARLHPGSREETTARVLLGRLLLDRGGDPTQALGLFTRYLEASPGGTLAEEARLGRALALTRMGQAKEERQAWQQLLAFHPNSIHAERARKRLEELH